MFRKNRWVVSEDAVKTAIKYLNILLHYWQHQKEFNENFLSHEDFPMQFVASNNYKGISARLNIIDSQNAIVPSIILLIKKSEFATNPIVRMLKDFGFLATQPIQDEEGYMRGNNRTKFPEDHFLVIFNIDDKDTESIKRIPKMVTDFLSDKNVPEKYRVQTTLYQFKKDFLYQLKKQFNHPKYQLSPTLQGIEQYKLAFQFRDTLIKILTAENDWLGASQKSIDHALDRLSELATKFVNLKAPTLYSDLLNQIEDAAFLLFDEKKMLEKHGPQNLPYIFDR